MYRFKEMLVRFMSGRYGNDNLNRLIFWLYVIMFLVYILTKAAVFYWIGLALIFLYLFRTLSRNIYGRQLENQIIFQVVK